jgi:hypothetical protein
VACFIPALLVDHFAMCIIPGDFVAEEKEWIRKKILPKGYKVPSGNVLARYLDACTRLKVSALSAVVQEINRRKCSMQPLPYNVMAEKNKLQKIRAALEWMNLENTDGLSYVSTSGSCLNIGSPTSCS